MVLRLFGITGLPILLLLVDRCCSIVLKLEPILAENKVLVFVDREDIAPDSDYFILLIF